MTNIAHELNVGPVNVQDQDSGVSLGINDDGSLLVPSGASTSAYQDSLIYKIIMMLKAISKPAWFDPSLNRLRETAVIESGTVTTVTTVTTLSNITSVGGFTAQQLVTANTRAAWSMCCRARII